MFVILNQSPLINENNESPLHWKEHSYVGESVHNNFLLFNRHWPAQSPRVGFVLFLDKKNQKSSHQEGFSAALAPTLSHRLPLPCKPGRTTGC
jgi:hypothetical protein